ncbi:hypothetical protein AGOR_G00061910 [Albula goreensis]|uniref:Ankyrin and armadillo repeat-containing protein n=1 Tax=Albula goreensis TaxID=1534307 RepID=A0A8T3DPS8_9TELE|nr:hypothetical protein AGOR_G00061910 [Albula goreensis]
MDVDASGVPQTKKDVFAEFLSAGLTDISEEPCYQSIYDEDADVDPTYEPNTAEEEKLFSQFSESILLKLTSYLSSCGQHENVFVFEGKYSLASAVRLTEDKLQLASYQRLRQRLELHERLVRNCLERKAELCKNLAYLKLITFLSVPFGLKSAAERGLSAVFHSLCRRSSPSHLGVLDEKGYSLLHHAAACNHAHILCQLAAAGVSLDQPRSARFARKGMTALHLAAQCGSLESLNCLLALKANYKLVDQRGWMAVHFAAYYGQVSCIQALCRKDPALIETQTTTEYRSSPLLLAATSGSVQALDFLLSLGADWRRRDSKDNSAVHLAVLYFHTKVLKHLIELDLEGLPVWELLVEMLQSEDHKRLEMAVRCMEALCVAAESFWKDIMNAGGIPALLDLLRNGRQALQCIAAAVVCHMSQRALVCEKLVQCGAVPVLLNLLASRVPELHSRCTVILADLASHSEAYQALIAQLGGIAPIVQLLNSDLQDVLVNVVRCIRALCICSPANQSAVSQAGGIPPLVEFLSLKSEVLQKESCTTLAELTHEHRQNQDAVCTAGAVGPLVQILRGRRLSVKMEAARALEAVADHNPAIQALFLKKSAAKHLLYLLKVFQSEVKEQGAVSLWVLAGQTLKQKRLMAEHIGYHFILEFLLSSSDKMQYVGCQAVMALSQDCRSHQDGLCKEKGVPPLVRLLRGSRTTERTLLCVIQALGAMCIGVAHTNNINSQKAISEEKAIPTLLELLKHHRSLQVKVLVAQTLACVMLGNQELQVTIMNQGEFTYNHVLQLLHAHDQGISLEAGYALSLFAYNNKVQQALILQTGGISIAAYEPFLESESETHRAKAAFQIVVLASVITDMDQVPLTARGITILVTLLQSRCPSTVILTAQLLASLAHTRAGISEGIVTMGAVEHLCANLFSEQEEVRISCACAVGYLSFNRNAHRLLLVKCRNTPIIYDLLKEHLIEDAKISQIFTSDFKRQKLVGLPSLSLEVNGGPPVHQNSKGSRSVSSAALGVAESKKKRVRSESAPPLRPRPGTSTANPKVRLDELPQGSLHSDQGSRPHDTVSYVQRIQQDSFK